MTNKDKQLLLLLKDLCVRLPYGVIVAYKSQKSEGQIKLGYGNIGYVAELGRGWWIDCKPYLRPMSSMTEEEENELAKIAVMGGYNDTVFNSFVVTDWLNKKMFDYRGLIEKGLALEATEGMYKTE